MPRPAHVPIGLALARSAKAVSRAFDAALAAAGGSRPTWLILLALKTRQVRNQRELAEAVDIQGATLSHHLDKMESAGLLTRRRDPANRRMHLVEMTEAGEVTFGRLREAAVDHDRRLRRGLSAAEAAAAVDLFSRLQDNVRPPARQAKDKG